MNTKIITWNEERGFEADELAEAAQIIRDGGLVAFPTETVYGLGGKWTGSTGIPKNICGKGASFGQSIDTAYCKNRSITRGGKRDPGSGGDVSRGILAGSPYDDI